VTKYGPFRLVTFGDSITAGYGASAPAARWTNIVAATKNWTLVNSGINGTVMQNTAQDKIDVIGGAAVNNGRDTVKTRVTDYSPGYDVCILYGLNDMRLNDAAFTVDLFGGDLGEVIDAIISAGTPAQSIVVGSPPLILTYAGDAPWNGGSEAKHIAYVAKTAAVAAAKGTKYIDVYQWMIDNGGADLVSVDLIHPNDAGYAQIAAAFLSVM